MNKILIIGLILAIFIVGFISIFLDFPSKVIVKSNETRLYQGPVPEGYNLEHFRKTGETIPLK